MGQQEAVLMWASGIVIRMAGKEDYTELKGHHAISFLCDRGKVVNEVFTEKVVAEGER